MKPIEEMPFGEIQSFLRSLTKGGFRNDHINQIVNEQGITAKILFKLYKKYLEDKYRESVRRNFRLVKTIPITVPDDYPVSKDNELGSCPVTLYIENLFKDDKQITCHEGTRLWRLKSIRPILPKERFLVKIFEVLECINTPECSDFLRFEKGIPLGAEGLFLLLRLAKNKLPNKYACFNSFEDIYRHNQPDEVPDVFKVYIRDKTSKPSLLFTQKGVSSLGIVDGLPHKAYLVCFCKNKGR